MAFIIDTESGSSYLVSDGRITRDYWVDRDVNGVGTIDRERGRLTQPAKVGERAVIELLNREGSERFVRTSRVTHIMTVPTVRKADTVLGRPLP